MDKKAVRKKMLKKRKALPIKDAVILSKKIASNVMSTSFYNNADAILVYFGIRGEVMTDILIDDAIMKGKKVGLPLITDINLREMHFYEYKKDDELKINRYGIPEPYPKNKINKGLVIMPVTAFDKDLNRIGQGGGFYDSYLKRHPDLHTIAIAYDFQQVDKIYPDANDIKPHTIITENNIFGRK